MASPIAQQLLIAGRALSRSLAALSFPPPVAHVYDPFQYAWAPYEAYIRRYGDTRKRVVLLGMNPGPFGMMQTGVPFGEVAAVRDWLGIVEPVQRPAHEHPARPIAGFDCPRSEASGRRLWGWAARRFGTAAAFFEHWFVLNYCPLVFLEASGRNFTPDKLPAAVRRALTEVCDRHLAAALQALQPEWAIGIGDFAERRLRAVLQTDRVEAGPACAIKLSRILHPSPASPAANRGWADAVDQTFAQLGVLPETRD
ncbi:single-stranded DNA-binding protein [Aquincola sp. S2]|uniref:Single-stranded DNA-binding protein n=1 Tax=Pseudaquabacterium terrae TaxID=2732868 RepID=A0ABX2EPV2_9BURK|nr:uracil-DNA glycosylase family protein [Aquabacterium terrae]NRF70714.1 single-stranded DNA-binding protein [Aquabacterium terrae]